MKTPKLLSAIAAVLMASSGLAACGGSNDSAAPAAESSGGAGTETPTTLRVAFTPGATTLQVHLAQKMGIFEEHGLDVQATEGLDLPTWAAGLGKQWDVALTSAGLFLGGAKKLNLAAVAGIQTESDGVLSYPLIVRGDAIKRPADLVGQRVGVASLTGNTVNSIKYLVEEDGGDPAKVNLVQVPFPAAGDQLKAGQIAATVSALPFQLAILKDKENKVLLDVQGEAFKKIAPEQDSNASIFFISNKDWAESNSEALEEFRASLAEAIEYINANKEESLQELSTWTKTPLDVLQDIEWPLPTASTVSADQVEPALQLLLKNGLPEADAPDLESVVLGGE